MPRSDACLVTRCEAGTIDLWRHRDPGLDTPGVSRIPNDDLFASRGNVLAQIAPPFRVFHGPDVLISIQRFSFLGITALLQSPYDLRLPMTVEVLSSVLERLHDRLSFEARPLPASFG